MPPSVRMIEMKSEVKKFQNEVSCFVSFSPRRANKAGPVQVAGTSFLFSLPILPYLRHPTNRRRYPENRVFLKYFNFSGGCCCCWSARAPPDVFQFCPETCACCGAAGSLGRRAACGAWVAHAWAWGAPGCCGGECYGVLVFWSGVCRRGEAVVVMPAGGGRWGCCCVCVCVCVVW